MVINFLFSGRTIAAYYASTTRLDNKTADQLGLGLQGHISILRARGLQPTVVYVDS